MSSFVRYKNIWLMYNYQIMSNSFGYIDIILLGMIAGFIILRLRSILGRKTGHEGKVYPSFQEKKFNIPKNDANITKQNHETLEGKNKKEFLEGAEIAYETILTSFANGDLRKLKSLLTETMYNNFSGAIESRNKEKIKSEFTFIGIKESSVDKYEKVKDDLFTTVKFVAEVISVKKKDNKIIDGNPDKIKFVTDIWQFTRNIKNKSPNWHLAEIISKWKKKKDLSQEDREVWQNFTKQPLGIYDKEQLDNKDSSRKERLKFDLHGFTLQEANVKVQEIIVSATANRYKEVLLITGKGLHSNTDNDTYVSKDLSKLKFSVPEFINNNIELNKYILSISQASIKDGGEGAILIKLKNL